MSIIERIEEAGNKAVVSPRYDMKLSETQALAEYAKTRPASAVIAAFYYGFCKGQRQAKKEAQR